MSGRRQQIYFTSDYHLGHANVLKFSNRPFKDVDHMREVIIKRFNAVVPENGTTYFLGDMGFGSSAKLKETMNRLNGKKILILGNHDKKANAMSRLGFDLVVYSTSLVMGGELVTITHCPLRGIKRENTLGMNGCDGTENFHREKDHTDFSIPSWGQFHLHGHTHAPNSGKSKVKDGRQWDVGVDGNGYRPVSISEVESWIALTKRGENEKNGRRG